MISEVEPGLLGGHEPMVGDPQLDLGHVGGVLGEVNERRVHRHHRHRHKGLEHRLDGDLRAVLDLGGDDRPDVTDRFTREEGHHVGLEAGDDQAEVTVAAVFILPNFNLVEALGKLPRHPFALWHR